MAWEKPGHRKGKKRLPEAQRQRVLKRYPHCWLALPGYCEGASVQIHHVVEAEDGGPDTDYLHDGTPQFVGVCARCHQRVSAQRSQRRAVAAPGTGNGDPNVTLASSTDLPANPGGPPGVRFCIS